MLQQGKFKVVVAETCQGANDTAWCALHGIDLERTALFCVKAKNHFRAAFAALCGAIIDGGHNGLVCAGYLARAGLKVVVVERRHIAGGACVTEEFLPGFRNSSCAYLVGLLAPEVIRDLELHRHGLDILERQGGTFSPLPDGGHIELLSDKNAVKAQQAARHPRDAQAYDELSALLDRAAVVMRAIARERAPDMTGGWAELLRGARAGWHLRHLAREDRAGFAALMLKSLGDFLDERFEHEAFKGVYGFKGLVGNMTSPYATGSAYVLLHHMSDARDVIVDKPATSLVGIAVKLACAVRFTDMPALDKDLDDFQNVEMVAVYRDAVRLAGLPDDLWRGDQP